MHVIRTMEYSVAMIVKTVGSHEIDVDQRNEGMGGLAKGLAIIEGFASREFMSIADAARISGATRAAARRCLLTLHELGYLERIGREFRPLARLRNLGRPSNFRERLAFESQALLEQARDRLNESVSLAVLEGDDVLFVARAEADHIVSTGVSIGARLPAFCSATGRVLLSGMSGPEVANIIGDKRYPRRTPKTLTTPSAIIREIRAAAKRGYALSDEELELGMRSLAIPVYDPAGTVIAAMSVSVFVARVSVDDLIGESLETLKGTARELERRLKSG
jgi:IclR family transcriptional regulator, pca regulon regulatory protein